MIFDEKLKIPLSQRLDHLNWFLISLILAISSVGFVMLYSAGGGHLKPWLIRQISFFAIFFPLMIFIAVTDITTWFKYAYPAYFAALIMVIVVDIMGHSAMGATRWFKLGPISIQPSEIMKVCTVFALARYFHNMEVENVKKIKYVIAPLLLIFVPAVFIFHQPDLGTATILIMIGISVLFVAGVELWKFVAVGVVGLISIPFIWIFVLYDYQKQRILTFINPHDDALGSGYNIIQSKIAIGSGGVFGKGILQGTQGQLNFLPEKQTDFIFTMLSEELGFVGAVIVIICYCAIIVTGILVALRCKHQYGRLLSVGIVNMLFIHMFINIGMVTGIIPVVGAPLPFVSYGGTITATMLIGFGLLLNVDLYKNFEVKLR